jgi:hypothetical protein
MTAVRRQSQTRSATPADARAYLDKAQEFLRAAEDSLGLGNRVAAAGNAIHAGIGAADASRLPEQRLSGRENTRRRRLIWRGWAARMDGEQPLSSAVSSHSRTELRRP